MTSRGILVGGCLCQAVRYEVDVDGDEVVDYCHCRACRKASGAPLTAWVQVAPAAFRVICGAAVGFASSARALRWFCGGCGSPVYMTDAEGKSVGVTVGTLDEPGAVRPSVHGWEGERVAWLNVVDGLPRYRQAPPYEL
jgi:hypothetical protein